MDRFKELTTFVEVAQRGSLSAAAREEGITPAMVKTKGFKERRTVAQGELRQALTVVEPSRTTGKRILVYDDVFTDGLTLNEVARALRMNGGANAVSGVSLCRQPFRPKPGPTGETPF